MSIERLVPGVHGEVAPETRTKPASRIKMTTFEMFRTELGTALNHLYDPDYAPAAELCLVLGCNPASGPAPLQSVIVSAISDLEPSAREPRGSRIRRDHDVLHHRFIQKLTQEETAAQLTVSLRALQRMQRQATYSLARHLWDARSQGDLASAVVTAAPGMGQHHPEAESTLMLGWHDQMAQELASLKKSAPYTVTDVSEALHEALELARLVTDKHGIAVELAYLQPDLTTSVHPSVLRQMLIASIGQVARQVSTGTIALYGRLTDGNVHITVTGQPAKAPVSSAEELVRGVPLPDASNVQAAFEGNLVSLWLSVPAEGQVTVLVVDDNSDVFHYYRRCTTGTRYRLVHVSRGQEALEYVRTSRPDLIVLDVMLPDVDGWKLLRQLCQDPLTKTTPVIVSSVIREEELALALGAVRHLSKPVEPWSFVSALDEARSRLGATPPT